MSPFTLRPRKIRTILTLAVGTVILVTLVLATLLDIQREHRVFEERIEAEGARLAGLLNDVMANALYFQDIEELRHLAAAVRSEPAIETLTVFDPQGKILVSPTGAKYPVGQVDDAVLAAAFGSARGTQVGANEFQIAAPVLAGDQPVGGVHLVFARAPLAAAVERSIFDHFWQGLLLLTLGLIMSALLARWLVRPIERMQNNAEKIAAGDFDLPLAPDRADELGALAISLHQMAESLKTAERDRLESSRESHMREERLKAIGQMASGIAHDFNNRLQHMLGLSELTLLHCENDKIEGQLKDDLRELVRSLGDARGMVRRLREYYRPRQQHEESLTFSTESVVERVAELTGPYWRDQALERGVQINLSWDFKELPWLYGNPDDFQEALVNLAFNAIDAMPEGGSLEFVGTKSEKAAQIEVRDNGVGMGEKVRTRCLEPFFTTKGKLGSGLGLATVYGFVRRHRGSLDIDSELHRGTTFRLRLPQPDVLPAPLEPESSGALAPSLSILIADDEHDVRRMVAALLEADGHRVATAANGREALDRIGQRDFDLVLTDRAMPEMTGDELVAELRRTRPEIPIIMLSGFLSTDTDRDPTKPRADLTIAKPVRRSDLERAVIRAYLSRQRHA